MEVSVDLRTELPPAKPAGPLRLGTKTVWGGTSTGTAGIMFFAPWDKKSTFPGDSLATLGMPIDQIPMLIMGPGA